MQSIMQTKKRCYLCGHEGYLDRHHCLHGTANRKLAEEDGLWVWLCRYCHTAVHGPDGAANDLKLKQDAESAWMGYNHKGVEDFIARYGKNYF